MGDCSIRPTRLTCELLTNPLAVGTVRPGLSWALEPTAGDGQGLRQSARQIRAARRVDQLAAADLWDSGKVESDACRLVPWGGKLLTAFGVCHWQVRVWDQAGVVSDWSKPALWAVAPLAWSDWCLPGPAGSPAGSPVWIGPAVPPNWTDERSYPAALLRRPFTLAQPIQRAVLYASARGLYEMRLNGQRVGDHQLAPEWTDYHRRVQFQAYDVTALVQPGDNVLGALLADGWACGRLGLSQLVPGGRRRGLYRQRPRLLALLRMQMADGTVLGVASNYAWRCSEQGPIRSADTLEGEVVDARMAQPGWDRPGAFDESRWALVTTEPRRDEELVPQPNESIRITQELAPVALTEPRPGVFVFDLGQNFAGWCRLRLRGAPRGTEVRLRHGEVLTPDGMVYRDNLRIKPEHPYGAPQEDRYIAAGEGEEVFEPRFTYHGFRYVEVTGLPARPDKTDLLGRVLHSAPPPTLELTCSEPLVNRLVEAIRWTLRSNLHSIPTDCPQRDERLGWMGDMQVFSQTACYLMDMGAFIRKWCADMRDAQSSKGQFPDFAPHPFDPEVRFHSNPGWADAGLIVPWRAWLNYGDRSLLAQHYPAMRRWIERLREQNPECLWLRDRGEGLEYYDWLNGDTLINVPDWPATGGAVPPAVHATAFWAYSTELLSRMAGVLGQAEDQQRYRDLAQRIRATFLNTFVDDDGRIEGDTQAGYALALHFDLLPDDLRVKAAEHMRRAVERYQGRLSTGIQSTVRIMNELTRWGMADLAYDVLLDRRIPGWLYMIDHGGTTVWERWDGYVEGRKPSPFQAQTMNSFNHYAIGAVGEWIVRTLGGLHPDEDGPGYQYFTLKPVPDPRGRITWAKLSYDSPRGRIACHWQTSDHDFKVTVTIPPSTTAHLHLPDGSVQTLAGGTYGFTVPLRQ